MVTMATKLLEQNDSRWLALTHEQAVVRVDKSRECKSTRVMDIIEYILFFKWTNVAICLMLLLLSLLTLSMREKWFK